jgi:hypothetical protein
MPPRKKKASQKPPPVDKNLSNECQSVSETDDVEMKDADESVSADKVDVTDDRESVEAGNLLLDVEDNRSAVFKVVKAHVS